MGHQPVDILQLFYAAILCTFPRYSSLSVTAGECHYRLATLYQKSAFSTSVSAIIVSVHVAYKYVRMCTPSLFVIAGSGAYSMQQYA